MESAVETEIQVSMIHGCLSVVVSYQFVISRDRWVENTAATTTHQLLNFKWSWKGAKRFHSSTVSNWSIAGAIWQLTRRWEILFWFSMSRLGLLRKRTVKVIATLTDTSLHNVSDQDRAAKLPKQKLVDSSRDDHEDSRQKPLKFHCSRGLCNQNDEI